MAQRVSHECLDRMLPTDAYHRGWHLTWWGPEEWQSGPVILGRPGQVLYQWDYIPSLAEVFEKCRELANG